MVELLEPLEEPNEQNEQKSQREDIHSKQASASKPTENTSEDWNVSMPATSFSINAFAEAWEYEGEDEDNDDGGGGLASISDTKGRKHAPGILAKRGNKTVVQLDLAVGKEATGEVRIPLYITYTYTAEDPLVSGGISAKDKSSKNIVEDKSRQTPVHSAAESTLQSHLAESRDSNLKSFSFWTSIPLGRVVPRAGVAGGSTLNLNVGHAQARRVSSTGNLQ